MGFKHRDGNFILFIHEGSAISCECRRPARPEARQNPCESASATGIPPTAVAPKPDRAGSWRTSAVHMDLIPRLPEEVVAANT